MGLIPLTCWRAVHEYGVGKDARVFLHVSDIHFKADKSATQAVQDEVKDQFVRDAASMAKRLPQFIGVLVCGDIAHSGKPEEYQIATEWLQRLCTSCNIGQQVVFCVPGNHDVDRSNWDKKIILQRLQEHLRVDDQAQIDARLHECTMTDPSAAEALFEPLKHYNAFALPYGCDIAPDRVHWEKKIPMNDGSMLVIRGLTSVLASNRHDHESKSRLVVGTKQSSITQQDGVEYITMCHHPPSWLVDGHSLLERLNPRVRMQLYGHRHREGVEPYGSGLRLAAGAMFPALGEPDWRPNYNIIALEIKGTGDARALEIRTFTRLWNPNSRSFVAEMQPGDVPYRYHEIKLPGWTPSPTQAAPRHIAAQDVTEAAVAVVERKEDPRMDPTRRLMFRFLSLSFDQRFLIAKELGLLVPAEDEDLDETARGRRFFARAIQGHREADLWDRVETEHSDPSPTNPFREARA